MITTQPPINLAHRCRCGKPTTEPSPGCVWHAARQLAVTPSRRAAGSRFKPLVVLDLNDISPDALHRLIDTIDQAGHGEIADSIRRQVEPPRMPEPGLGGAVKSATRFNTASMVWLHEYGGWRAIPTGQRSMWDDLTNPTPVRDDLHLLAAGRLVAGD